MLVQNISEDLQLKLLNSSSINTNVGLIHFNQNKTLYIKILNSFIQRYENLNLKNLTRQEQERTLHTMRGLTQTLGMEQLASIIEDLEEDLNENNINFFYHNLKIIIDKIRHLA